MHPLKRIHNHIQSADWRFVCERADHLVSISWRVSLSGGAAFSLISLLEYASPGLLQRIVPALTAWQSHAMWWDTFGGSAALHLVLIVAVLMTPASQAMIEFTPPQQPESEADEADAEERGAPFPSGLALLAVGGLGAAHYGFAVMFVTLVAAFTLTLALVEFGVGLGRAARQAWKHRQTARAA